MNTKNKKRENILKTLKLFEKEYQLNSKSAIILILSLIEETVLNCIALNLSSKTSFMFCCCEEVYFEKCISQKIFNKYFFSKQEKCKTYAMDLKQKKEFLKKLLKTTSDKKRCIKNVIPTYLDCFIPDIFSFIPYNLNTNQHSNIVFQYLKQLDPIIDSFSRPTFYVWFQHLVKNQDSIKSQLLLNSDFNMKISAQADTSLQPELRAAVFNNSSQQQSENSSAKSVSPVMVAPSIFSQYSSGVAGATITEFSQSSTTHTEENTPSVWVNSEEDEQMPIINEENKKKIDEYNQKRNRYCPKPILPLIDLSPNDPKYPFDKKYEGFFYDQQGLIFDSLSKREQSDWCPIPKVLELNGNYPNMKSYKWRFVDQFNSVDVISIYSNNLDSFVFEHFGDNSTKRCSFYTIKKGV